MKDVKARPYSFTSKESEANAAIDHLVYVIEVQKEKGATTYWMGYRYRAADKVRQAGGLKWEGEFDFKNIASIPPDGAYLEKPRQIADHELCNWLSTKQPGMAEIPAAMVEKFEELLRLEGKPFA
ncbi:MAG: hypothetical protein ACM3VZ_15310 [Acidobacteriota bacterium]